MAIQEIKKIKGQYLAVVQTDLDKIICYFVGPVLKVVDSVDKMIQHACPLGMGLLFCAGVYWSAFTYGFVVVLQVSRKCRFIFTVFSLAAQIKSCLEISKLTKNTPNFMIFFQNIMKIRYYCSFYIQ